MNKTSLVLIDTHEGVRSALGGRLRALGDFELLADTGSTTRGLDLAARLRPGLIILDFGASASYAAELCARVHQASPESKIVVYTAFADEEMRQRYAEAGAAACLLKDIGFARLADELRRLRNGRH
jgi:DNA-binding NarL/FixJ family response regulator